VSPTHTKRLGLVCGPIARSTQEFKPVARMKEIPFVLHCALSLCVHIELVWQDSAESTFSYLY